MCFGLAYFFYDVYAMYIVFKVTSNANSGTLKVRMFFERWKFKIYKTLDNLCIILTFFLNTCRKYSHLFSQDFCWWLTICFYHFLFFPYLWVVLNLLMVVIASQLQGFYWKPQPRLFHCEKYSPSQVCVLMSDSIFGYRSKFFKIFPLLFLRLIVDF